MATALISTKILPCLVCEGTGYISFLEPYTKEVVPRICMMCCSYGNLEGSHYELFNEKTAAFRERAAKRL